MTIRTTRSSVTFLAPFRLASLDLSLPPGTYEIDTEEEVIEGNGRSVFLRVATLLRLHSTGMVQTLTIDPAELEAALTADRRA